MTLFALILFKEDLKLLSHVKLTAFLVPYFQKSSNIVLTSKNSMQLCGYTALPTSGFITFDIDTSIILQPEWNSDLRSESVIRTGVFIVQCKGLSAIIILFSCCCQFLASMFTGRRRC